MGPWCRPSERLYVEEAVWEMKWLAQFLKENADKLDARDKELLAKELEELLKYFAHNK